MFWSRYFFRLRTLERERDGWEEPLATKTLLEPSGMEERPAGTAAGAEKKRGEENAPDASADSTPFSDSPERTSPETKVVGESAAGEEEGEDARGEEEAEDEEDEEDEEEEAAAAAEKPLALAFALAFDRASTPSRNRESMVPAVPSASKALPRSCTPTSGVAASVAR